MKIKDHLLSLENIGPGLNEKGTVADVDGALPHIPSAHLYVQLWLWWTVLVHVHSFPFMI